MQKHNVAHRLFAVTVILSVLLCSCVPVSDDTAVTEPVKQTTESYFEPVVPIVSYEQIMIDNDVTSPLMSVIVGDYLIFSDMTSYDKPSNLIAMNLDTNERKVLYKAQKGIVQIQPVDKKTLALGIIRCVDPENIELNYYYYNLNDGSVRQFSENPNNRKDSSFKYPIWINGFMVYEIIESEIESSSRQGTNPMIFSVYCKTPDGVTVPIAIDVSSYYVENNRIYYRLYDSSVERVCDIDGTDGEDRKTEAQEQYAAEKYEIIIQDGKIEIKNNESEKTVKVDSNAKSIYYKGHGETSAYFIIYDIDDNIGTLTGVELESGKTSKIIPGYYEKVDVFKDFLIIKSRAPGNENMYNEYNLQKVNKDGTGLEKLN